MDDEQDATVPTDTAHAVIDGGNDTDGWAITGVPPTLRWTPHGYAVHMAAWYEAQRQQTLAVQRGDEPPPMPEWDQQWGPSPALAVTTLEHRDDGTGVISPLSEGPWGLGPSGDPGPDDAPEWTL